MRWTIYNKADGSEVSAGWPSDPSDPENAIAFDPETQAVAQGDVPDPACHLFSPETLEWQPNIPVLQSRRWQEAKDFRAAKQSEPLAVYGVSPDGPILVDTDTDSRLVISGAVQMATIMQAQGLPYSITFTAHDNTAHTLDATQVIALGLQVATYIGLCHSASQTIRTAIEQAGTVEELSEIDIEAGYPGGGNGNG